MGTIWGRQDPGGPHVGPMKFAIWDADPNANEDTQKIMGTQISLICHWR